MAGLDWGAELLEGSNSRRFVPPMAIATLPASSGMTLPNSHLCICASVHRENISSAFIPQHEKSVRVVNLGDSELLGNIVAFKERRTQGITRAGALLFHWVWVTRKQLTRKPMPFDFS